MKQKVRITGILIEENLILLVEQDVTDSRAWSLPGGTLELGKTIEQCLVREMKEETGLDVAIAELLYVCDRIQENHHVVHMTFLIERVGGKLQRGYEPESGANIIKDVKMVSLDELQNYGFSSIFYELAKSNFPNRGTYKGDVHNIGL